MSDRSPVLAECQEIIDAARPATAEQFALIVERFALHYPEAKLTPQERKLVMRDWLRLLGHLPADMLEAAADAYVMSPARFFPTPGQFNAVIERAWNYRQALARRARETLDLMGFGE